MKKMTEAQLAKLETDLNAIRDEVLADLGERDARYIRKMIRLHRSLEAGGRLMMPFGFLPPVDEDETLAQFVRRRLGNEALDKIGDRRAWIAGQPACASRWSKPSRQSESGM